MGSKQNELESLDRLIKDSNIRLHTFKTNIDSLDREITTLQELEITLEENIKCLKQNNIVPIASEYKKAMEDMKKTKNRLVETMNQREGFKKNHSDITKLIKDSEDAIERIKKSGENNVIRANFGKKENG
jgi:DNA repair exonuclease SbcCD ATPase subunit